jgi:Tfp pilus assembly protein PilF
LACLLTLALPVLMIGSQRRLDDASHALYASRCKAASEAALRSIDWLDVRAQPYEVLGLCDVRRGFPRLAVEAFDQAVRLDPSSWQAYYGRAIAKAAAAIDPRSDARRALRMNPYEPLTKEAARRLDGGAQIAWLRAAGRLVAAALRSRDLSFAPA